MKLRVEESEVVQTLADTAREAIGFTCAQIAAATQQAPEGLSAREFGEGLLEHLPEMEAQLVAAFDQGVAEILKAVETQ